MTFDEELNQRQLNQVAELRRILDANAHKTWKPDFLNSNQFYANIDDSDCLITVEVSRRLP